MASLSQAAVSLAGFTLAHAVWNISDTTPDDPLAPLAMIEVSGQRKLVRFEGDTPGQAIERARAAILAATGQARTWAFVRESTWHPDGILQTVLVVEFWGAGMDDPATALQPFERAAPGRAFRLLGHATLAFGGAMIRAEDAKAALDMLDEGIMSHKVAAKYWSTWAPEEPRAP